MGTCTVASRRHFLEGSEDTDGVRRRVGGDTPYQDPVAPSGCETWHVPWA